MPNLPKKRLYDQEGKPCGSAPPWGSTKTTRDGDAEPQQYPSQSSKNTPAAVQKQSKLRCQEVEKCTVAMQAADLTALTFMQHKSLDIQPHTCPCRPAFPSKPLYLPIATLSVQPLCLPAVQIRRARAKRDHLLEPWPPMLSRSKMFQPTNLGRCGLRQSLHANGEDRVLSS